MPGTAAPLAGVRVLDLSTYVAGPSGTMALARLGADVIRVDPIGGATDTRRLPRAADGTSLYWRSLNAGKRSIEVDTSTEEGRDLVRRLVALPGEGAGIVVTNNVGQGWLDASDLQRYRPDVIVVHILGRSDGRPAVDYTVNCEVGLPLATGPTELDLPVNHVLPAWDLLTGMHTSVAVLAALRHREREGGPQDVTVSLADVAMATVADLGFVADVHVNGRGRLRDGNYLYGSFGCDFATCDGERVMVVALTERHWRGLLDMTGLHDVVTGLERSFGVDLAKEEHRYEYREVLAALLRPWFESRGVDEVTKELDAHRILWGRYQTVEQAIRDDSGLLAESPIFQPVDHDGTAVPTPASVLRFAGAPALPPQVTERVGAHTDEVLAELLGLEPAGLADLHERGVLGSVA